MVILKAFEILKRGFVLLSLESWLYLRMCPRTVLTRFARPTVPSAASLRRYGSRRRNGCIRKTNWTDLIFIGGSSAAVSALVAEEIDFLAGGADPIVSGILSGADLAIVGFISHTTPMSLYVAPGIFRVEDLKGKTVAVTRFASSTAYMMRVCLTQFKMDPGKDVPLIQSGGSPGWTCPGERCL